MSITKGLATVNQQRTILFLLIRRGKSKMMWNIINNDDSFKRESFAHGVYKDRYIIVAGGRSEWVKFLRSVVMYDVYTNSHTNLPDLPECGECFGAVLDEYFYVSSWLGRKIYRICLSRPLRWELVIDSMRDQLVDIVTDGADLYLINCGKRRNSLSRYNPISNELIYISRVPCQTNHTAITTAIVGDKIFIIGGNICTGKSKGGRSVRSDNVQMFDFRAQSWSQGPNLPEPLSNTISCVMKRWIIVSEAQCYKNYTSTKTFVLDTLTGKWTENDLSLRSTREYHGLIAVESQLISVGGRTIKNENCLIEASHANHFITDCNWKAIKELVLLHKLIEENRAELNTVPREMQTKKKYLRMKQIYRSVRSKSEKNNPRSKLDADIVIQKLFTETPLDIFRNVISYLF